MPSRPTFITKVVAVTMVAVTAAAITLAGTASIHAQPSNPPPAAPTLEATIPDEPGRTHLAWSEVPGALTYQVWYGPTSGGQGQFYDPIPAPQKQLIVYGLNHDTEYSFNVMVKVSNNDYSVVRWSLWSDQATVRTPASTRPGPAASTCERLDFVNRRIRQALQKDLPCADVTAAHLAAITHLDLSLPAQFVTDQNGRVIEPWDQTNSLHRNAIQIRPQDLAGLYNATELNLSNLGITHLTPEMFTYLPQLTELRARRNQIRTLPAHVFAASPNLSYIDLSYNQIDSVAPDTFAGLTQLEVLDLDYNQLESMPDRAITNSKHPHLRQLSLILNPGSEAQLASLSVRDQANAQGAPIFVCLMIDQDRQCVDQ